MIQFQVEGTPLPTPRPKATSIGNKARVYVPDKVRGRSMREWKAKIAFAALEAGAKPTEEGVAVLVGITIPRPQSHFTKLGRLTKSAPRFPMGQNVGDIDNLLKAVFDSLNGIAWKDDGQIVWLQAHKRYTVVPGVEEPAVPEGVRLWVWEAS